MIIIGDSALYGRSGQYIFETLKNFLSDNQIVISIMAGISTDNLYEGLGIKNVIRVMPNTPGQIGKGISVWYKKNKLTLNLKKEYLPKVF